MQWGPGAAGIAVGLVMIVTAGAAAMKGAQDAIAVISELESRESENAPDR